MIRVLLAAQNKSRGDLLAYLGIRSDMSLSRLTHANPTADRLEKMADFFNMPVDIFFKREITPADPKALDNAMRVLRGETGSEK